MSNISEIHAMALHDHNGSSNHNNNNNSNNDDVDDSTVNIEHDVDGTCDVDEEDVRLDHNSHIPRMDTVVHSCTTCPMNNNNANNITSSTITAFTSTPLEVVHLFPNQRFYSVNNGRTDEYPTYNNNNNNNNRTNNNWEVNDNIEPISICIGYIFASKKMNTMSVVMAEASKVRLGLLCTPSTVTVRNTSFALPGCNRGYHDNYTSPTETKNQTGATVSMGGVQDNTTGNQFTLTKARLLTHEGVSSYSYTDDQQQQPLTHMNNNNNTYGSSGSSKAKKSLYNGSSTSTPSSSSSSQQNQQPSLSFSSQSTVTTNYNCRSYEYQTKTYDCPAVTNTNATTTNHDSAMDISTGSTQDQPLVTPSEMYITETYTSCNQPMKNVIVPIRISFVPLDDSLPFKEQHSGKIDIILHKLTEDILHASQQMIQQQMIQQQLNMKTESLQIDEQYESSNQQNNSNRISSSPLLAAVDSLVPRAHRSHDSMLPLYFNTPSTSDIQQQQLSMERIQQLLDYNQEQEELNRKQHDGIPLSTSSPYDPMGCLIDHPMAVRKVMCRAEIADTLQQCLQNVYTKSGIPVRTPKYAILRHNNELLRSTTKNIQQHGAKSQLQHLLRRLSFPIIVKPLVAAGTKSSHAMTIIMENSNFHHPCDCTRYTNTETNIVLDDKFDHASIETSDESRIDNLHELNSILRDKYPCLCQEYSNHDAKLYKVYVLGDHVSVHQRRSLPNLPTNRSTSISTETDPNGGLCNNSLHNKQNSSKFTSVEFDSQRPYPHLSDFGYTSNDTEDDSDDRNYGNGDHDQIEFHVTVDEVHPIVKALKQAFHLELFGFDILVTTTPTPTQANTIVPGSANTNKMMLVVDVNYFPSYKELTNFPSLLAQYLAQRAIVRRQQQQQQKQHKHTQQILEGAWIHQSKSTNL